MNEYKNFFKKVEKNISSSGAQGSGQDRRVRIQNPLDKTLRENSINKKAQNFTQSRESSQTVSEALLKRGVRLQDLEAQLAKGQLKVKGTAKKSKAKSRFPVRLVGTLSVGFGLCLWSLIEPDSLNRVLNSFEFSAFGTASASATEKSATQDTAASTHGKEKSSSSSAQHKEEVAEPQSASKPISAQQVREWSDEELSFFNDLNKRKEELEKKEKDLAQLEEELQKRQSEIEEKIKELEKTRSQIAGVLQDRVKTDEERVDKLVQFYSGMKPANAARIISTLEEGLAITILNKMKKQDASAILNFIEPQRAKEISEKFAGYAKAQ